MEQVVWHIAGESLTIQLTPSAEPPGWYASTELDHWGATVFSRQRDRAVGQLRAVVRGWLALRPLSTMEVPRLLDEPPVRLGDQE
jgi:hypothetical protein